MGERNPYAPSQASLKPGRPGISSGQVTAWRDKRVMVMIPETAIPHRCIKCNEPADEPTKERTLYWHSPWLYLLLLINILIFAIVALIVRKKTVVSPALCPSHKKHRRNVLIGAWIGVFVGMLLPLAAGNSLGPWSVGIGILIIFGSLLFGMTMGRIVYAARIDKDYVRLKGWGEPFLGTLPEFPY